MKLVSAAAILFPIFLAGCATPQPAEYGKVPGPSHSAAGLPTVAALSPEEDRNSTPVEKRKPATTDRQKPSPSPKRKPATTPATTPVPEIVTPDASLRGKVTSYKEAGRFVVLEFPIAHLPGVGQRLFVYRDGLKIGEVKVSGPHRDDRTVADLTTGEALPGDEVREQ